MKKLRALTLMLRALLLLPTAAYADAAIPPVTSRSDIMPWIIALIVAVLIVAAVILVRVIGKKKRASAAAADKKSEDK